MFPIYTMCSSFLHHGHRCMSGHPKHGLNVLDLIILAWDMTVCCCGPYLWHSLTYLQSFYIVGFETMS